MDFNTVAQIVRFHRQKSGLSRNDLATLADVGKTVIFDIEHGKQSVQWLSLMKVLTALNIQLALKSPFMDAFYQTQSSEI